MRLERELLGRAFVLSLVAGAVCVVVALVAGGGRAAVSAAVGAAMVAAFLAVGQVPVAAAARGHRGMAALLLLLGYLSRVMLLLLALLIVLNGEGLDRVPVGVSVMATAAAWTVGAVWAMVRWRPVLVEPAAPPNSPPRSASVSTDEASTGAEHQR
jgi:hypothetical protein